MTGKLILYNFIASKTERVELLSFDYENQLIKSVAIRVIRPSKLG